MTLLVEGFQFGIGQALGVLATGGLAVLFVVHITRVIMRGKK